MISLVKPLNGLISDQNEMIGQKKVLPLSIQIDRDTAIRNIMSRVFKNYKSTDGRSTTSLSSAQSVSRFIKTDPRKREPV